MSNKIKSSKTVTVPKSMNAGQKVLQLKILPDLIKQQINTVTSSKTNTLLNNNCKH